jgi:hypothetical protein
MPWLLAQSKSAREAQIFTKIHAAFIGFGLSENEVGPQWVGLSFSSNFQGEIKTNVLGALVQMDEP